MPASKNILGPDPARGAVTLRPNKVTVANNTPYWFNTCANPNDPNQTKITTDFLNDILGASRELIATSGAEQSETAAISDLMLAEATGRYASLATGATCTNTGNAYTLTAYGNTVVPKSLFLGMRVLTRPSATNTGDVTVNVFGLGSKKMLAFDGSELAPGMLVNGRPTEMEYRPNSDDGNGAWLVHPWGITQPNAAGLVYDSLVVVDHQQTPITVGTRNFATHLSTLSASVTLTNPFAVRADLLCVGGGANTYGWAGTGVAGNWRPTVGGIEVSINGINESLGRFIYAPMLRPVATDVAGGASVTRAIAATAALASDGNNSHTLLQTYVFLNFLWARRAY